MKTFDRKETKYSYCTRNKQKVTIGWTYFGEACHQLQKFFTGSRETETVNTNTDPKKISRVTNERERTMLERRFLIK